MIVINFHQCHLADWSHSQLLLEGAGMRLPRGPDMVCLFVVDGTTTFLTIYSPVDVDSRKWVLLIQCVSAIL